MCEWLLGLGAQVHGFALPPATEPSLFEQLGLAKRLNHTVGDVRDLSAVRRSICGAQPDFVFHLAAQPLVRVSYEEPVATYSVNVLGAVHVLDALRAVRKRCAAVFVTSDKCYENREWIHGYREGDALGGYDPYSSSKAAAEIAIAAYRRSFFSDRPVRIASARAGNVIGGGDWAVDRIVPDCIRALRRGVAVPIRNKAATRPWQHVLEPLGGYLWLAAVLAQPELRTASEASVVSAFNFGPARESNRTVVQLVEEVLRHWPGRWEDKSDPAAVHEAGLLQLSTDKAFSVLGWWPIWTFPEAVEQTVKWYRASMTASDANTLRQLTRGQILQYEASARASGVPWARVAESDRALSV